MLPASVHVYSLAVQVAYKNTAWVCQVVRRYRDDVGDNFFIITVVTTLGNIHCGPEKMAPFYFSNKSIKN